MHLLQFSSGRVLHIMDRTDAFENARAAMDAILMNIQLADTIELKTDADDILSELHLTEIDPEGDRHAYVFEYDRDASTRETRYRKLNFNGNEFASRISELRIIKNGDLLNIKISGEAAVTLECTASIRHKVFN